jgi:hypothetical protein
MYEEFKKKIITPLNYVMHLITLWGGVVVKALR